VLYNTEDLNKNLQQLKEYTEDTGGIF